MSTGEWITVAVAAALVLLVVVMYNRLVGLNQRARAAWSDIDVQLKRRADLVPSLVEIVKGYAAHERQTFEEVARLRAAALSARSPEQRAHSEYQLSGAIRGLFVVAEAYPELKASASFRALQDQLSGIENTVQIARRYYNAVVRDLNTAIEMFPSNVVAGTFRFHPRQFFQLDHPEDRQAPRIALDR